MNHSIALREWAVAVKALEEGRQVIVLRKGGIAEETKEFRLESPHFYLFPSYEHQRPELIKREAGDWFDLSMTEAGEWTDRVQITSFAEVVEDIEVTDAQTLHRLAALHIWTEDYAEERLKWKKTKPLHVLILRVYKLDAPEIFPMKMSYGGCKSWLKLDAEITATMKPVLADDEFERQANLVRKLVNG